MKYVVKYLASEPKRALLVLFYDARGDELARSQNGLFRALLHQAFTLFPETQYLLDSLNNPVWSADDELLKSMLLSVLRTMPARSTFLLIDALDECPEDQVRNMLDFMVDAVETLRIEGKHTKLALSSRHYPRVTLRKADYVILELSNDHNNDIRDYIRGHLDVEPPSLAEELTQEMFERSAHVFLWVTLAVRRLQLQFDRGNAAGLRDCLQHIPTRLEALFDDIINSGGISSAQFDLCVQCVLFAARPIALAELYWAMVSDDAVALATYLGQKFSSEALMQNFILTSSKGLVEINEHDGGTVQFVHESVREYLMVRARKRTPSIDRPFSALCHDRLKRICWNYLRSSSEDGRANALLNLGALRTGFPFAEYASDYILYHAEHAKAGGVDQMAFLHTYADRDKLLDVRVSGLLNPLEPLIFTLCRRDLWFLMLEELVRTWPLTISASQVDPVCQRLAAKEIVKMTKKMSVKRKFERVRFQHSIDSWRRLTIDEGNSDPHQTSQNSTGRRTMYYSNSQAPFSGFLQEDVERFIGEAPQIYDRIWAERRPGHASCLADESHRRSG